MAAKQLRLGAFMRPISIHTGAWRYPGACADANFNIERITRLAQTLDANFVVLGSYSVSAGRLQAQAQVLDVERLRMGVLLSDSSELPRLLDAENALAWKVTREMDPGFRVSQQTFLAASNGVKLSALDSRLSRMRPNLSAWMLA